MSDIDFLVRLKGGEQEGEFRRFRPGEVIAGSVQLVPHEDINSRAVRTRLEWHTEGRGTRATGTFGDLEIAQGRLKKGMPLMADFRFNLPLEPWSFAGHYINIIWEIVVVVDIALGVDTVHRQPFVMRPNR